MPSWPIHIAIANKLNKKLNLGDDFILGNVLPDTLNGYLITPSNLLKKSETHFHSNKKITPELFIQENKNFDNPIILGYLTHLLTDYFYNTQLSEKHFLEENNKEFVILNDGSKIPKSCESFRMKQYELAQYGYNLSDEELGKMVKISETTMNNISELNNFVFSNKDIEDTVNLMNRWITKDIKNLNIPYKLYNKSELDYLYEKCYKYLIDYLSNLKAD